MLYGVSDRLKVNRTADVFVFHGLLTTSWLQEFSFSEEVNKLIIEIKSLYAYNRFLLIKEFVKTYFTS